MKSGEGSFRESARLLWQSPELLKVVLASGLLAAATIMSPATPLVLTELRSEYWGDHMADYSALVNSANGLVAMAFSSSFGRLGDFVDRRIAMLLAGVLGFLPTWALLVIGQNSDGLAVWSVLTIIGGIACVTVSGCPTCYALVADVIPPGEREIAFGCCFAGVVLIAISANVGGLMVNALYEGSHKAILLYCLFLDLAFFITLAFIRLPGQAREVVATDGLDESAREEGHANSCDMVATAMDKDPGGNIEPRLVEQSAVRSTTSMQPEPPDQHGSYRRDECETTIFRRAIGTESSNSRKIEVGKSDAAHNAVEAMLAPAKLILQHESLRYLCVVAALVSLPEIMLTDVSAQYALNQFDLIASHDGKRQREVILLFQWPGYALLLPAFVLTGVAAKLVSSLRLLRWLILVTGAMTSLPVVLRFMPRMWLVPIVGISVPLAMVVFSPLQTLITEVAPQERIGEAMGAVGASKQIASLVSNIVVSVLVPFLLDTELRKPLWIFYPMASCSSLLALVFALRIQVPLASAQKEGYVEEGVPKERGGELEIQTPKKEAPSKG